MSRFYLILLFLSIFSVQAQKTRKLIKFADEQYQKGDYYYAIEYYNQALKKDSLNLDLMWKQAEAFRAYKDYSKAEVAYAKIYARDKANKYPFSVLYLGLMQKQNGKYSPALNTFKLASEIYKGRNNSYEFKKASKEIVSTQWAMEQNIPDSTDTLIKLPLTVNSYDAEFGHNVRDNHLIFSSLRADSLAEDNQEVYSRSYKTRLYSSEIKDSSYKESTRIDTLVLDKLNSGNGSFSVSGRYFYFSMCEDEGYNYRCQIMRAEYLGKNKWGKIDTLDGSVNVDGKNSTMPHIAIIDNEEYMFFASNRNGSLGGLDLYYAPIVQDEVGEVSSFTNINSLDNELSPFFDAVQNRLYFSSSWHNGFGGQDIFYSEIKKENNSLVCENPVNAGLPLNSPANDLYYFTHKDTVYLSSNRLGSYFSKNPTCCSDIYSKIIPIPDTTTTTDTTTIVQEKIKKKLPVVLYFQNDEPDAKNWSPTTKLSYSETYDIYKSRYPEYLTEVVNGVSGDEANKRVNDLTDFFTNFVDKGVSDLNEFKGLLLEELKNGSKVILTVKGFASPLAKTNYNVNLTKRRITSLVNYFNRVDNGLFAPYLNNTSKSGGKLEFVYAPFGEFSADQTTSDNFYDQKNSVYSREAGIERKIHIDEVTFEKNEKIFPLKASEMVFTAGILEKGQNVKGTFKLVNSSNESVSFKIENQQVALTLELENGEIEANKSVEFTVNLNSNTLTGFNKLSFSVFVEGYEKPLELFVTTEVK